VSNRHPFLTCKIASLCISPVQAGIISFKTENSSFILDLRRRSMRLCAVFLAIFRPAALEADGCFFFTGPASLVAATAAFFFALGVLAELLPSVAGSAGFFSSWALGFIWMILRDLVGGGGRAKLGSLFVAAGADGRRLDLTASLGCILNGALGEAGDSGDAGVSSLSICELARGCLIAGGGSSKANCSGDSCLVPSCPAISVEEAGVGGNAVRGMVGACVTAQ
jgi:hypothetical protein